MARKFLISRVALAIAMASGMAVAAPTVAVAKKAPKETFSKEYAELAGPLDTTLNEKKGDPALTAAMEKVRNAANDQAKEAARGEVDTVLGGIRAKVTAANAVATTPLDKVKQGEITRLVGIYMDDPAMQYRGAVQMIESGALEPEVQGQVQFIAGVNAYKSADYTSAAKWLKTSYDGGYRDDQNMIQALLADSYKKSGNSAAALQMVKSEIDAAKAAGSKPSDASLRTALQAAYDSKDVAASTEYAAMLAQYYPSPDTWNVAISIVRQLTSLPKQQNLDLMRLMHVTGAMKDRRDYIEYIDNLDPRAYPGEAAKVMQEGQAKGKLTGDDVADLPTTLTRAKADKASIAGQGADANKAGASVADKIGAGDVFLSYEDPAKAEGFYSQVVNSAGAEAGKVALRLGMAQVQQGKYAEANSNFAKVSGPLAPVAKMWSAYASSKMPAAAATAPAATQ